MAPDCVGSSAALHALGQAEVGDVRLARRVEQDVGRLQVAVQDAALVGVMHRPRHRRQQPGRRLAASAANVPTCRARLPPSISFMLK